MQDLTIQAFVDGGWSDAVVVTFEAPDAGIHGPTRMVYDDGYFFDKAVIDFAERTVIDRRAVSVKCPVNLESTFRKSWPAWLLDLMPQGAARRRLAESLEQPAADPAIELQLLKLAGGGPIGNLRIKEAWQAERRRLAGVQCPPLTDLDIAGRSEAFLDVVDRFALLASGSSGVQGDWPKALMTRNAKDGFWYPDPVVATGDGIEHMIVKLLRSNSREDALIIASEAPYLLVAEAFGLNVAAPLDYSNGVLRIPRFDRTVIDGEVRLHGQESLVSALGVAEFGHIGFHEDYLAVIRAVSDDPVADTLEYLLRDVLNTAMGNPDNHGRNTALTKPSVGGIRLAPLYDFAPMCLSAAGIGRSTRWRCLSGRDLDGSWRTVCDVAACDGLPAERLRAALLDRAGFLRDLPRLAGERGVGREVIERACARGPLVAAAIEKMAA